MSDYSEYTSSQKKPNKTKWSAKVEADEGYLPGRLNKENGVLESNTSIYATNSIDDIVYILIDQYNHQHIKVTINDKTVYENERIVKCKLGDTYKAEIIVDTGYNKVGEINSSSGKLYKNKHLMITKEAEPKLCKVTIPATDKQQLVFYSLYTIQYSGNTSKSFTIPYDTNYSIEIIPEYGYNKGTSNHKELTAYTLNTSVNSLVNKNDFSLNITCTNVTKKKYTITIPTMDNETVTITANNTTYNSTVSLDYLTEYKINIIPKDKTYVPGRLIYPTVDINSNKPTNRSFILIEDVNIKITPAHKIEDGVFYLQYLDGDREIEPLSDYTDDDWYLSEPYVLTNLVDNNHREELYYLGFSGTKNSNYLDVDDNNSYAYKNDKVGIKPTGVSSYNINIIQSENQKIMVSYLGLIYTSSFKADEGESIECSIVSTKERYTPGKLNYTKISDIDKDYTISATSAVYVPPKKYTLTIIQSAHQTIKVYVGNESIAHTSTFEVSEGSNIHVTIESDTGYTSGFIIIDDKSNWNSTILSNIQSNHTISASNATPILYKLTILQSSHQTIIVTANGITYTSDVNLPYGTKWTATIKPDSGYAAGGLTKTSGTITGDDTVQAASPATRNSFTLKITQSAHQLITVIANGKSYTSDVNLSYGTTWTASITTDSGYTAGTLNKTTGTIIGDDSIYASSATLNSYSITISPAKHQIITVTIIGGESFTTGIKTLPYGTKWYATVKGEDGYTAGVLNMSNGAEMVLVEDVVITSSEAKLKTCTITITQSAHQTITVTANGNKYTSSTSLPYGTKWTAAVEANEGYNVGKLNISSGTLAGNITVKATDAIIKSFTLKITQSAHQTITVTANGKTYTSDVVLPYGTKWKADFTHVDNGYTPGNLNKTSGTIFSNDSVYASAAEILKYTITAVQLSNTAASLYAVVNGTNYKTSSFNYGTSYNVRFELTIPIISATLYINNTAIPSTIGYDSSKGYYYALSNNSYNLTSNVTIKVANVTGRIPKIGYVTDIT